MFIERSEVYFIVQADLEEAISRGEQARPMFSLMDARVALPVPGDKLVFADVSYTVIGRTFSYEAETMKVIISLEL